MTPERWRQINELFHAALELTGAARQSLLDRTAASDPALADEVRSLLAVHHSSDQQFLEEPAWAVAPTLAFDGEPWETINLRSAKTRHRQLVFLWDNGGEGFAVDPNEPPVRATITVASKGRPVTIDGVLLGVPTE